MASTRRRAAPLDPATIAAMSFEPLALDLKEDLPDRARFMEHAGNAFACVAIGATMLTKDPTELAAALKAQGEDGIFGVLDELAGTREWFAGFVRLLEAVEVRALIAAARVAMAGA